MILCVKLTFIVMYYQLLKQFKPVHIEAAEPLLSFIFAEALSLY